MFGSPIARAAVLLGATGCVRHPPSRPAIDVAQSTLLVPDGYDLKTDHCGPRAEWKGDTGKAAKTWDRDLDALARLGVEDLAVDDEALRNIHRVDRLAGLRCLDLTDTAVSDLQPLAGATALEELVLDGTPVEDLSPLAGLPRLVSLSIGDTAVVDLEAIAGSRPLRELYASGLDWQDTGAIATLTNLRTLDLSFDPPDPLLADDGCDDGGDCGVPEFPTPRDLVGISSALAQLEDLDLSGWELQMGSWEEAELTRLTSLRRLDLSFSSISAASGSLPVPAGLVELDLRNTRVNTAGAVAGLRRLERLDLRGTHVTDIDVLASSPSLRWLAVDMGEHTRGAILRLHARRPAVEIDVACAKGRVVIVETSPHDALSTCATPAR